MKASEQSSLNCAILFIIIHLGGESTDTKGKQGVLFSNLFRWPVAAVFDSPQSSSDGGSLLLKACDAALGLTESLASWLRDGRQPGKVVHGLRALLRQRVFSIACGYAGNDASRLRRDPVLKLLAGRDPEGGRDLASQPTVSRFENSIRRRDLLEAAKAFAAAPPPRGKADRDRLRSDARGTAVEPVQPLL